MEASPAALEGWDRIAPFAQQTIYPPVQLSHTQVMSWRRLPPLHAIRAFEAVARHLSMTRAAEELGVTPGAVSRHIRALEEHLQKALFLRQPGGLILTSAGEALAQATREGLDRIADGV